MKYIDEYRDRKLVAALTERIRKSVRQDYKFMEVCGGHTAAIRRFGLPSLLPENITLISGPGCPVCVTGTQFIDKAVALSLMDNIIIASFGDLIRVPGSESTLEKMKASGADVRIVFSGIEALNIARMNPGRSVIFPGIGFETTAPGTAVTICEAQKQDIRNFLVLNAHKVMPPAMETLLKDGTRIDGFICPGHVATITGSRSFDFIPRKYKTGCVITGFEPVDLLQSVLMLIEQVNNGNPQVQIQYKRAVTENGNILAQKIMNNVFGPNDAEWRGIGIIKSGGLAIKKHYEEFDAEKVFNLNVKTKEDNSLCICGDILRGLKTPFDCPLFGTACIPTDPVGACMVSDEGACNSYYKYRTYG